MRCEFELPDEEQWATPTRGRPQKEMRVRPVAGFRKNIREAAKTAFDRGSGKPIPADKLMSYAEALAQYYMRSESKFLNGDFCDCGRTERRHVARK